MHGKVARRPRVDLLVCVNTLVGMSFRWVIVVLLLMGCAFSAHAGTVYKCWRDGTASISTLPEPGSRCTRHDFIEGPKPANVWEEMGLRHGTLYFREQNGQGVYSTRNLPGSKPVFSFTLTGVQDKMSEPEPRTYTAHARMGVFDPLFHSAAKRYKIEEAYLRAVAHAESGYSARAVSPKGAMGVMQLMPETAARYGVEDPFQAAQSINAGARHLASLLRLYRGDRKLAAAAYNAGVGAVEQYGGVPPFAETREYVRRVEALYQAYVKELD